MGIKAKRSGIALVALSAMAIGSVGLADAASTKHARAGHSAAARGIGGNPAETVLTGATLASASSAATAAVAGGTIDRASIEVAGDPSGAAYEVHVTKPDGSHVVVLEDASFKVLSTNADRGPGGRGGHGGPIGNPNEAVLSGATLTSASDAAVAAVPGGTVDRASAEAKGESSGAAYEVHVTKTDGSDVVVLEDTAFKVLSVNADDGPGGPGGPGDRFGHGGPRRRAAVTSRRSASPAPSPSRALGDGRGRRPGIR